jgi:hypothetical protein
MQKTKPYKDTLIELITAPSSYILLPLAYAIVILSEGLLFGHWHSYPWLLANFIFFVPMCLLWQARVLVHQGSAPVSTQQGMALLGCIDKAAGSIVLPAMLAGTASALVAFMAACFTNFEGIRPALLTATPADVWHSLFPFMLLGGFVGVSCGLVRWLSSRATGTAKIQRYIDLANKTIDMTRKG